MASKRRELSITIPPEIITEILYRLPAKSIGRFRCVSKSWLSQLTHPNFLKIHLKNNTSSHHNKHLIFTTSTFQKGSIFLYSHPLHSREFVVTTPTKFDPQLNSNPFRVDVCSSCDGLVLVRAFSDLGKTMVVINPTIRECLQLPGEEIYSRYDTNDNEYDSYDVYGFGYDSVTDDYKVVSLTFYCNSYDDDDRDDKVYVQVYSLRNKKWRRVTDSPYGYYTRNGDFYNGFIYWIVSTNDDDLLGIAAFSLADECFSNVPLPKFCNTLKSYNCQLLVFGGKLALFIGLEGVVWLMNEFGVRESWTKILLNGIDKFPLRNPKFYNKFSAFDDNGKILVANNDRMMAYDVEKEAFTETVCVWNWKMFCIAGFYIESLVSPKLVKEEEEDDDDAQDEHESNKDDGYDSWKAKHREEKLRGDRLEEALNHALSKQQALERRTMEQGRALDSCNDEIESLKARLAVADEERKKALAGLSKTGQNTLN